MARGQRLAQTGAGGAALRRAFAPQVGGLAARPTRGAVVLPDGVTDLPLGTIIECLTPHCDPAVNLHDFYHIVRGDTLVDIWPVDARGAF